MNFREEHGRLQPQRGAIPDDVKTRIAMNLGAEMQKANDAVAAKPYGVELAERAAASARAAYLVLIDAGDTTTPSMDVNVVCALSQQQYAGEWNRLRNTPREEWHR